MKKFICYFSLIAFVACNNDPKVESMHSGTDSASKKDTAPAVIYPYEIGYSSQFDIGNTQHSKIILDLWKDFDAGDVSVHKDYMADSVEMIFTDGSRMHATRDSIIASTNGYRSQFSSVKSTVDAVVPLRSTDKNEDWVTVWGKEIHTRNGKTDSVDLHEVWRFNKNGKVDFMMQYKRDYKNAPKK